MLAAVTAGTGHPAVAILLGLGAAALAGLVVAMAWSVHIRQFRLAGELARRQFIVTPDAGAAEPGGDLQVVLDKEDPAPDRAAAPPVVIDGPDSVVVGEQARYRARRSPDCTVVSWAVGGGSVSQAPDPAHPDELMVIAERPGDLMIFVRAREGMLERRATKSVSAVPDVTAPASPVALRLFLQGWGLVVVAVLAVGFAGALVALGSLGASDFIALAAPLAALLGVVAIVRASDDAPGRPGKGTVTPSAWKPYTTAEPLAGNRNGHHRADTDHR